MNASKDKFFRNFRSVFMIMLFFVSSQLLYAEDPPPPPPGHGSITNVPGGGAPIGGGLFIMIAGAAFYGVKKYKSLKGKEN